MRELQPPGGANQEARTVRRNPSRKTIIEVGHALETSAALHVLSDVPTGKRSCEEALKRLRRALRLPKDFSFTTARTRAA